jgi:hypothetical protein
MADATHKGSRAHVLARPQNPEYSANFATGKAHVPPVDLPFWCELVRVLHAAQSASQAADGFLPMNMGKSVVTLGEVRILGHSYALATAGHAFDGITRLLDNVTATPASTTAA